MCWELRTLCLHADICVCIATSTVYDIYYRFVDTQKKYVVEMYILLLLFNSILSFNTEVSAEVWWRGTIQQLVATFTVVEFSIVASVYTTHGESIYTKCQHSELNSQSDCNLDWRHHQHMHTTPPT